ncbi:MAG: hypothetical protein ACYDDO_04615 [Acidiferrobacterales bacterium]
MTTNLVATKHSISAALLLAGIAHAGLASAVPVSPGTYMTITAGVPAYDATGAQVNVVSGSWFAFDINANGIVDPTEKTALSEGTTGLVTGTITSPGAYHPGAPLPGDSNQIDKPYDFFGSTGSDYLTVPIGGSTTAGLNLSGWTMAWNTSLISLGSGAWTPSNCTADIAGCGTHTFSNGNAQFNWDGVYGDAYTLNYSATIPAGDPSGIGGAPYFLHLEGIVPAAMPIPATIWLLVSGLIGLSGFGSRRNQMAKGNDLLPLPEC